MKVALRALFAIWRYGLLLWVLVALGYTFSRGAVAQPPSDLRFYDDTVRYSGWPVSCTRHEVVWPESHVWRLDDYPQRERHASSLWLDCVVCLGVAAGSLYTSYSLWPRILSRQFRIATILRVMVAVAVMLVVLKFDLASVHRQELIISGSFGSFQPITLYPWWIYLPVLYGIACTTYGLTVLVTAVPAFVLRRRRGVSALASQTTA